MTPELSELEDLVTHGRLEEARAKLLPWLKKKRLPPELVLPLASLARRAWLADRAVALLHKRVRPSARKALPPTAEEKLEYATSLIFLGAHREARTLLEGIDPGALPETAFSLGLALFSVWDWTSSLPLWDALARNPRATGPQRLRGRLYHAVALAHGVPADPVRAIALCEGALPETGPRKARPVHKSLLLTQAQALGFAGRAKEAAPLFDRVDALCADEGDRRFELHSRLWRAIGERDRAGIARARAGLFEQGIWEQLRVADYHAARLAGDEAALTRLWYGTPFAAFRARVERDLRAVPDAYAWRLGDKPTKAWIDASNGRNSSGPAWLKEGTLPQRLLAALASDFYARPKIAQLHEELHPGTYYHPTASPAKVHEIIRRLRGWLKAKRVPLELREHDGEYRLFSPPGCEVRVRKPGAPARPRVRHEEVAAKLRAKFGARAFSATEAAEALDVSYASAKRLLNAAREDGLLRRTGAGPATRFSLST